MELTDRDRAVGVVARKNWSWRRRINTAINHIVASGSADHIFAKWFGQVPCKKTSTFSSLDIKMLKYVFILLAGFMAGLIVLTLVLRIASKFYQRRGHNEDEENC